jgi:hypothetical protein
MYYHDMTSIALRREPSTATLVDLQFWFLGHDIKHAEGNALVRFGFERVATDTVGGTTCYVLPLPTAEPIPRQLVCWGFAAYVGPTRSGATDGPDGGPTGAHADGVLVARHTRTPLLLRVPLMLPLHRLCDLPRGEAPRSREEWSAAHAGVAAAAAVFADYERWASATLGEAHRDRALALLPRHKRRRFVAQRGLAEHWDRVCAARC